VKAEGAIDAADTFDGFTPRHEANMANPQDNAHDIRANEQTYGGFIGMLKWSLPLTAVLVLVIILVIQ
jgi:Bacterial aa3 type cytochrome c oxidase subunit IV